MISHSYLAVDLFFLLSGFVVSSAYEKKIATKQMTIISFCKTRVIRLYPLYLFALLFSAVILAPKSAFMSGNTNLIIDYFTSFLFNLFFLPYKTINNNSFFAINGVSWSLFFELIVNLIYCISHKYLSLILLLVTMFVTGFILFLTAKTMDGIDYGYTWESKSLIIGFARSIFGFTYGIVLFRIFVNIKKYVSIYTALFILLLITITKSLSINNYQWNGMIDMLCIFIIFPFCIIMGAKIPPPKNTIQIFNFLGFISYPVYLFHNSIGILLAKILRLIDQQVNLNSPSYEFMLMASLIAISFLLDKYYDRPIRYFLTSRILNSNR